MTNIVLQIEALHQRLERARQLIVDGKVSTVLGATDHYVIESSTGDGVWLVNGSCDCPDAQQRAELTKGFCKHRLAAILYQESVNGGEQNDDGEN